MLAYARVTTRQARLEQATQQARPEQATKHARLERAASVNANVRTREQHALKKAACTPRARRLVSHLARVRVRAYLRTCEASSFFFGGRHFARLERGARELLPPRLLTH